MRINPPLYTTFFVFTVCVTCCYGSKYSADKNKKTANIPDFSVEERPYRMQKVNLLWEKAKKRLRGPKLAELYADLLVHDKHEAALKKYRTEGMDKDGLREAQVTAAFREIIEKFGLDDFYDTDGKLSNELPLDEDKEVYFSDKKLQSMWKRAEEAGFSARDLEKLREEFWHQQMKIDELNFMKREMELEDVNGNDVDISKKSGKTTEQAKDVNQDMKKKHKDIKAGYYNLEGRFQELDREEQPEFKDHRVYHLWALAQKTGWSPSELEAFKKELNHFENRLQKHEFFETQRQLSAENLKNAEVEDSHFEKHRHLEEKTEDIAVKVKKLHKDLKTRVSKAFSGHSEL